MNLNESHAVEVVYSFSLQANGRCGIISCSKGDLMMEIEWEMSGVPDMDILMAPVDLNRWRSGQEISLAEQRYILDRLRTWLHEKGIRADIVRPVTHIDPSNRCVRAGCDKPVLEGYAYCPNHYDESLLKLPWPP